MATRWAGFVASGRVPDVLVIALTVGIAVTSTLRSRLFEPTAFSLGVVVLACLAIWWRRRFPEVAVAIGVAALLVAAEPAPVMLAAGNLAALHGNRPRTWLTIAVVSVPVLLGVGIEGYEPAGLAFIWGSVILLPVTVGLYLHSRQLAVDAANERADELAAAQELLAQAARHDERTRIAREMHDVVAHQVSLIALQAGALEVTVEGTPAADSARMIGETARQALEELRNVVGVLRTDENAAAERAPQPSVGALGSLVSQWRDAGMDVTLVDSTPSHLLAVVPAQIGLTAYRVVEEALTNASKHAAGAPVEVAISELDGCLSVVIHNAAPTRISSRAATGSGSGLYGLRERVELVHGFFEAGPDGDGGYRVSALLPMGGGTP